ncbi:MAG: [FeFe] hydrogenase H-cluster radical SAM maturase HydE [Bacteroidota bacterium]|nr:[FeFe] hydrogenase H-cluster radical SAM maturase HydE [Bacteroidota bacterium]
MSLTGKHTSPSNALNREKIKELLSLQGFKEIDALCRKAFEVKKQNTGNKVYLRGLLELSNICRKNCYYCGICRKNTHLNRYTLKESEVLDAVQFAYENNFGSLVMQSGERSDKEFVGFVDNLLQKIHQQTNNSLGITLSLGEQSEETYKRWFESGAERYLLRIETSNEKLYYKLHPKDKAHSFTGRIAALKSLKKIGYQTGTGIMIGLPFQSIENLAEDLLFMKDHGCAHGRHGALCGTCQKPLCIKYRSLVPSKKERFQLSLKMIATLRLLMPDINIASTTALETLNPNGRLMALEAGANVFMPNLTPVQYREDYFLYEGKPGINTDVMTYLKEFDNKLKENGQQIGWGRRGIQQGSEISLDTHKKRSEGGCL